MEFSYGYNGWGAILHTGPQAPRGLGGPINPGTNPNGNVHYRELAASRVKSPADMIAIADNSHVDGRARPSQIFAANPPAPIHRGGVNVLFCDGHVQWHLPAELKAPGSRRPDDPAYFRAASMWNYDHRP